MANLYEIDEQILSCVDMETGEIIDTEKFDSLNMARDVKIENICLWIKNLNAQIEALKAEEKAFVERRKTAENKMDNLKQYITGYLNGTKFETSKVKVSYRKSEALEISESAIIPETFVEYEPKVDKRGLKTYLKDGGYVDGVTIILKNNIQIK